MIPSRKTRVALLVCLAVVLTGRRALADSIPGRLDPTFASGGVSTVDFAPGYDYAWSVARQADGKIVAAGVAVGTNQDFAVARWNDDGTLDPGFGTAGKVTVAVGAGNELGKSVAVQPDGRILVGGPSRTGSYNDFAVIRLLPNGSLDATFGTGGKVVTSISSGHDYLNAIALQTDGKVLGAGYTNQSGNLEMAVVRWNSDGTPDASFGTAGSVVVPSGTGIDSLLGIAVQPDGKIVAVGYGVTDGSYDIFVIRLTSGGALDAGFGAGGRVKVSSGGYAIGQSVALQPDGRIVVGGYATNGVDVDFLLVRLTSDGGLDASFGGGAPVLTQFRGAEDTCRAVAIQSDGRIVSVGNSYDGAFFDVALARHLPDGSVDPSFGVDGKVVSAITTGSDTAFGVLLAADQRIVVAGSTSGDNAFLVARYQNVVCGNQVVETGEGCDAGAANGDPSSCCGSACAFVPVGTTCRASGGSCDVAESCDGVSATCPADAFVASGTTCRASAEVCDAAEACSGTSAACPADGFVAPGTTCRASAGVCDAAEACSGTSAACPADGYAASGTTCRASSGACDAAETCTGTSIGCPADGYAASGTTCRASSGACDAAETCTGTSIGCPADAFAASGTTCRASSGACDAAETCTGTSIGCPADAFAPAGTTCRPTAGTCDVAEACTGSGPQCPADVVVAQGTVCRPAAGICDVAEACTGGSGACPADVFGSATIVCRAAAGSCDVAETCTGSSADCPANTYRAKGTVCRAEAGACDVAETCTGLGYGCPADLVRPAGTSCRAAAEACDFAESCDGTSVSCPIDEGSGDADGDGVCDATDVCLEVADPAQADADRDGLGDACDACSAPDAARSSGAVLQISRLRYPRGTQDLSFKGRFQPFRSTPAVNPLADGLRLVLVTGTGREVIDALLPGGAYDSVRRVGWRRRLSEGKTIFSWTHSSTSVPAPGGIVAASITVDATGLPEVTLLGKTHDYVVEQGEEQLRFTLVVQPAAVPALQCGDMANGTVVGGPTCKFADAGRTLRCQ